MGSQVTLSELQETVAHLEHHLRERNEDLAVRLMAAYVTLLPRFQSDLKDARDELLSRGGALMLIQQMLRDM